MLVDATSGTHVHTMFQIQLWFCVSLQVVPEPVDKWQDVGVGHHNVLQAFYDNQERFAYTFQNYVFVTRMMQVCCPKSYNYTSASCLTSAMVVTHVCANNIGNQASIGISAAPPSLLAVPCFKLPSSLAWSP